MGINFTPDSTLGFVLAISLVAYLGGIYIGHPGLTQAAKPILLGSGAIWLAFVGFSLVRNVKSIA